MFRRPNSMPRCAAILRDRLPPEAVHPDNTPPTVVPAAFNPYRSPSRRENPMAPDPFPVVMSPDPRARDPHIVRSRCRPDFFDDGGWRLGTLDDYLDCRRRWRWRRRTRDWRRNARRRWRHRGAACRIDHGVNDLFADAALFQVQDVRRAQTVDGMGIPDLTQDDFVTHASLRQHLDVCHAGRRRLCVYAAADDQRAGHDNCQGDPHFRVHERYNTRHVSGFRNRQSSVFIREFPRPTGCRSRRATCRRPGGAGHPRSFLPCKRGGPRGRFPSASIEPRRARGRRRPLPGSG